MATVIKKKIKLPRNITPEFAVELKECFDWQDRNGDGLVSKECLLVLLRATGQVWSLDEIEKICHGLGSREVDFQTYLDLVSHKVMLKPDKEELRTAFNVLDSLIIGCAGGGFQGAFEYLQHSRRQSTNIFDRRRVFENVSCVPSAQEERAQGFDRASSSLNCVPG
ncbi:hypothetical protein OJ253_477 [Cryptosporidium canis]|uniref:EF-hand domain-containing protein n=1 Tax=Cryptosporidium canis TaxID=195482 RepID=A0A9D5DKY8_9CRYT|nr:hypothetical protein OJ253_477 [Cryptosporidium canis]